MIRNTIIALIVSIFWSFSVFSQTEALDNAMNATTEGNYKLAQQEIDKASFNKETASLSETWYYRLYIYKEIYKNQEQNNRFSKARDEAILAYVKFKNTSNKKPYLTSANKIAEYLVSSYYNNAVLDVRNNNFDDALINYNKYKDSYKLINPNKQFGEEDIDFQLALANGFMNLYESNRTENKAYFERAKNVYEQILEQVPNNWNANYNLGILIYNKAVSIIKYMDYDVDLYEVDELQAECVKLFFSALPYMKKAHELNPIMSEPIVGLTGIYYSLHEDEQYIFFKSMLNDNRN